MKHKVANIFFILAIIFYIFAAILALNNVNFDLVFVLIGIILLAVGLFFTVKCKISKNSFKQRVKINKEYLSIGNTIPKIVRFLYQDINKIVNVGVANINEINSTILDVVTFYPRFYIHKQVERKGNLLFMRIKKRAINLIV